MAPNAGHLIGFASAANLCGNAHRACKTGICKTDELNRFRPGFLVDQITHGVSVVDGQKADAPQRHPDGRRRVTGVAIRQFSREGVAIGEGPVAVLILHIIRAAPADDVHRGWVRPALKRRADLRGQHGNHRVKVRLIVHAHAGQGQLALIQVFIVYKRPASNGFHKAVIH